MAPAGRPTAPAPVRELRLPRPATGALISLARATGGGRKSTAGMVAGGTQAAGYEGTGQNQLRDGRGGGVPGAAGGLQAIRWRLSRSSEACGGRRSQRRSPGGCALMSTARCNGALQYRAANVRMARIGCGRCGGRKDSRQQGVCPLARERAAPVAPKCAVGDRRRGAGEYRGNVARAYVREWSSG